MKTLHKNIKPTITGSILVVLVFIGVFYVVVSGKPLVNPAVANLLPVEPAVPEIVTRQYRVGQTIFNTDCRKCHAPKHALDNILNHVIERRGEEYVKLFITKQDSLYMAKNSTTMYIKELYNIRSNAHNFEYNTSELKLLIAYLK